MTIFSEKVCAGMSELYTSRNGNDSLVCGKKTRPCKTMQYALMQYKKGTNNPVLSSCLTVYLDASQKLDGSQGIGMVGLASSSNCMGKHSVIKMVNPDRTDNITLDIENLTCRNILLQTQDIDVKISNSKFDNASLSINGNSSKGSTILKSTFRRSNLKALKVVNANIRVKNCTFLENTHDRGSAISVTNTDPFSFCEIEKSTFERNFAAIDGGAIYAENCKLMVEGSTFMGNSVGSARGCYHSGGAIYVKTKVQPQRSSLWSFVRKQLLKSDLVRIQNSNFTENQAGSGGALYLSRESLIINCSFSNNQALS